MSVQIAIPMNEPPNTQRMISGLMTDVIHAPKAPANPWLTNVATKMPAMIGKGRLKRAARINARSCVLSPISARATTPVEMSNASIDGCFGS